MDDTNAVRLTREERARLRATINIAALERYLARVPAGSRQVVLLACAAHVTEEDIAAAGLTVPAPPSEAEIRAAREVADRHIPPGTNRLEFLPTTNYHIEPAFDDPELRALWDEIEPKAGA